MTEQEAREFAEQMIRDVVADVEKDRIMDLAPDVVGREISSEEMLRVLSLVNNAQVSVSWE